MAVDARLQAFRELFRGPDAGIDVGRAALTVAQIEHPDLDVDRELRRLDALADRVRPSPAVSRARLDRLRRFLFDEEGFRGNVDAYYDPRNSCLNDVLDRHLGIPITLSVLLMEVGRRVGLAIDGIGLPGHFIVAARVEGERVLLDPFNGGAELSAADAEGVVARTVGRPVRLEPAHWTPCTPRQIVVRMLRNLKTIYARQERWDRALGVVDRLLVVDPETPSHVRDRGTVLVRAGRLCEGAAWWERYL
ncbi:MAG TPA: transglutaminase-like domain-containing protein, partial [Candidatus Tectomicrobia bacterium]|nr:transglutaminase-like domain-containing protein [Candidatus Tectomicrobia bacterium]